MIIHKAEFIGSFPDHISSPQGDLLDFAFIGRSNVGKSSLINAILNRKKLALVSNTPGKTKMLNFYMVNEEWHLVDLPGYGYAKVSKKERRKYKQMIDNYLKKRNQLACIFLLMDASISSQKMDRDMMNWLGEIQAPFVIVFTKTDKLKTNEVELNIENMKLALLKNWEYLPQCFEVSSIEHLGIHAIREYIHSLNQELRD